VYGRRRRCSGFAHLSISGATDENNKPNPAPGRYFVFFFSVLFFVDGLRRPVVGRHNIFSVGRVYTQEHIP
jgi:hypothetical protein